MKTPQQILQEGMEKVSLKVFEIKKAKEERLIQQEKIEVEMEVVEKVMSKSEVSAEEDAEDRKSRFFVKL